YFLIMFGLAVEGLTLGLVFGIFPGFIPVLVLSAAALFVLLHRPVRGLWVWCLWRMGFLRETPPRHAVRRAPFRGAAPTRAHQAQAAFAEARTLARRSHAHLPRIAPPGRRRSRRGRRRSRRRVGLGP